MLRAVDARKLALPTHSYTRAANAPPCCRPFTVLQRVLRGAQFVACSVKPSLDAQLSIFNEYLSLVIDLQRLRNIFTKFM